MDSASALALRLQLLCERALAGEASATSLNAVWMAFSYWATATLRDACALSRLADWRPHQTTAATARRGVKPQEPFLNRPDSSPLDVPAWAVGEMRGKKRPALHQCWHWRRSAVALPGGCRDAARADRRRPAGTAWMTGAAFQVTASQGGADVFGRAAPAAKASAFSSSARWRCCWASVARSLRQRFGLPVVELGRSTRIQPQFGQANRLFAGSQECVETVPAIPRRPASSATRWRRS